MMKIKIADMKPQFRVLNILRDTINVEARTVELAFSSEATVVDRYYGGEILDHGPSSVRLGRLSDGAPLLVNHDPNCQVGVVESVKIGSDRVGRAIVRFGKSDEADEIFNDVVDGIRTKVSVGYTIFNMILDSKQGDSEVYRITDWEPSEISIVSIPADNSVGVGRSIENPKKESLIMEKTAAEIAAEAAAAANAAAVASRAATPASVNVQAIQDETRNKELTRVRELNAIGDKFKGFGGEELARQYINEGKSIEALREAILERAGTRKPVETGEIGLTDGETRQYSFIRVMNALANPKDRKAQENAAFEFEASRAAADKRGKETNGIIVPYDVMKAPNQNQRALAAGTGNTGGYLVQTDLLSGSFIDLLRNRLVINACGATTLNGLTGNVAIPRQSGGATAYWVAEAAAPSASNQTVDQVTMNPKTVGAFTDYSRKLLIQSSIDVENMVRMDLAKIIALEVDRVALYGAGNTSQPTGIKNTTGISTKDLAAATPTFAEVVGMETLVAAANADIGTLAYLVNATMRGSLKTAVKVTGYPTYIWGDDAKAPVNGYRTEVSNQVASGDLFFGNWADLVVGFWSGLDLTVDPFTGSSTGSVRVVALQDCDVAVRHPLSFVRANDSL